MGDKRIPISEENRERLKAKKRGDETYDDVVERLMGDEGKAELTAEVTPELDADAVDDLVDELQERLAGADPIDRDALARAVAERLDYAAVADRVAEQVVADLEGRVR